MMNITENVQLKKSYGRETITILEAGLLFGKNRDQMKLLVESKKLTKIKLPRVVFKYLLLKEEIEALFHEMQDPAKKVGRE